MKRPVPLLKGGNLIPVPKTQGIRKGRVITTVYDQSKHREISKIFIDELKLPKKRRIKSKQEKYYNYVFRGYTYVMDCRPPRSDFVLKAGFDRNKELFFNVFDSKGAYGYFHLRPDQARNLFSAMLMYIGIIPFTNQLGTIERFRNKSHGRIYLSKRYYRIAEEILNTFLDQKIERKQIARKDLALLNKQPLEN